MVIHLYIHQQARRYHHIRKLGASCPLFYPLKLENCHTKFFANTTKKVQNAGIMASGQARSVVPLEHRD